MRILFIVPYTPSLIRVRSYNLIRYLAARGNQVTVLTLHTSESERADAEAVAVFCDRVITLPLSRWRSLWNSLITLPTSKPLQSAFCWQPTLAEHIRALVQEQNGEMPFDIVHVEHLRGARYGLFLEKMSVYGNARLPIVWDSVDCISTLFEQASTQSNSNFGRWITRFELIRTKEYEGWLVNKFNRVLVTSAADRQALISLADAAMPQPYITVVPNGVDLDYFQSASETIREPATLVVSGKMSYHANISMVHFLSQDIMPLVWDHRPEVKLIIVGKDPPRKIQKLAQHPAISVTGTVEDIRPYLQRASIAVVPLTYGAGTQYKALEAMACATPVIATPQVTVGLGAVPDHDLIIAQDETTFADKILTLLDDTNHRRVLGARGRAFVENHHNWETITAQLEDIYASAIGLD